MTTVRVFPDQDVIEEVGRTLDMHSITELWFGDMSDAEFSAARTRIHGIGGSTAGAAIGVSPWKSVYAQWCEDTGEAIPGPATPRMRRGKQMEPMIARWGCEEAGIDTYWNGETTYRSLFHPYMIDTPDRFCVDREGQPALIELKNVGQWSEKEWRDKRVPEHVQIQALHGMIVTGLHRCLVIALIDGWDIRTEWIEYDLTMASRLIQLEERYWDLVEARQPPAIDGTDSTTDALSARYSPSDPESTLELATGTDEGDALRDLIRQKRNLAETSKVAKESLQLIDNSIKEILGEAETCSLDGLTKVTWKSSERKEYTVAAKTLRTLRLVGKDDEICDEPF